MFARDRETARQITLELCDTLERVENKMLNNSISILDYKDTLNETYSSMQEMAALLAVINIDRQATDRNECLSTLNQYAHEISAINNTLSQHIASMMKYMDHLFDIGCFESHFLALTNTITQRLSDAHDFEKNLDEFIQEKIDHEKHEDWVNKLLSEPNDNEQTAARTTDAPHLSSANQSLFYQPANNNNTVIAEQYIDKKCRWLSRL